MDKYVLGVDIGGTHITAAIVDLYTREILQETVSRSSVNAAGSVEQIISEWSNVLQMSGNKSGLTWSHIGIAMPGPFDYEKGIALMQNQNKYDALYGINVKDLLAQHLRVDDIKFENDAACFILGEAFAGAAKGFDKAIGLTLGTGLGSAVYAHGKAWDADLWRLPFYDTIAEEYLSSRWFAARYFKLTGKEESSVKNMAELAATEPAVQEIFTEFGQNLALFLKAFVQQEKPEVIILGGNISKSFNLFGDALMDGLQRHGIQLPVKLAELGEEAALLGAASLWLDS